MNNAVGVLQDVIISSDSCAIGVLPGKFSEMKQSY